MKNTRTLSFGHIAVAGTAGGAAEVLWIGLAASVLGVEGGQVARAVAATVVPAAADSAWTPWLGLAIHFALSFVLAAAFLQTVASRMRGLGLIVAAVGALTLVWAVNFFVLLPALNPAFTTLLPLPVTLVSKVLFGLAMGLVFARAASLSTTTRPAFAGKG